MNQEFPKPLRDALARQAAGDVHPSPDVLTSFVERTLAPGESEVVTHHLAQCAECREVVFLASNAAEDEVRDVKELVAAVAAGRAAAALPVFAAGSRPDVLRGRIPRSRWAGWMRRAVSVSAAAMLVAGWLVLQLARSRSGHNPAPITIASNRPAPVSPEAQQSEAIPNSRAGTPDSQATPPTQSFTRTAPHPTAPARAKRVPAPTPLASNAADEYLMAPAPEAAPKARHASATAGALVGGLKSAQTAEVRPQSSYVESESAQKSEAAPPAQLQQRAPALFGKPGAGMHSVSAVRPQWRIGPNGHLERSLAADQWTRVLDDQPVTFHAVAVIAGDVWAGGNGGALFHSSDGGEHWSKVPLPVNPNVVPGAVVAILFDDAQHGSVASDSGTRWVTTDGGVTWTIQ